jgi:hypothetical protein
MIVALFPLTHYQNPNTKRRKESSLHCEELICLQKKKVPSNAQIPDLQKALFFNPNKK